LSLLYKYPAEPGLLEQDGCSACTQFSFWADSPEACNCFWLKLYEYTRINFGQGREMGAAASALQAGFSLTLVPVRPFT
jgi:hypothetical protein